MSSHCLDLPSLIRSAFVWSDFNIHILMYIPLQEFCMPKTTSNDKSLRFITTYNPDNPNFYETIEKSVECLTG